MRIGGIGAALAVTAVLLTGCGASKVTGTASSWPIEGTPRGVALTPSQTPPLNSDEAKKLVPDLPREAPMVQQFLTDLRRETLKMTGFKGETSGKCKDDKIVLQAAGVTDCTVSYEGVEVPWQIVLSETFKESDMLIQYKMRVVKGVLHPKALQAQFAHQYRDKGDELRCDEMPKVELVEPGSTSKFKCQYRSATTSVRGLKYQDVTIKFDKRGAVQFS